MTNKRIINKDTCDIYNMELHAGIDREQTCLQTALKVRESYLEILNLCM